jgi:3-phenylpropionate/trans-cinnamate dioxygenase ferredoxin component
MAQWIAACATDDIDPEDVIPFDHGGNAYAIYRSPDGAYYATDGHCSHEQTLLCDGLVMGDVIECPKHNGRFDYTSGKALGAPVLVDLRTYPTKVIDGTVHIDPINALTGCRGTRPAHAIKRLPSALLCCLFRWRRQVLMHE